MDLIVLFQQRKETYLGEYAPEIVFACTEYEYEEEGADQAMKEAEEKAFASPDIAAVKRFRLKFPGSFREEIRRGLIGESIIETPCMGVQQEK
jgi:hypothetical protein